MGRNEALYGATSYGGAGGADGGTVYKLAPTAGGGPWTIATLHSFGETTGDGIRPQSGLAMDANGALYGTTSNGGAAALGTVYQFTPPQAGAAQFRGGDQRWIYAARRIDVRAERESLWWNRVRRVIAQLWDISGQYDCGVLFRLAPAAQTGGGWTETILYNLQGQPIDGALPVATMIESRQGAFYGTTSGGGAHMFGTVFKLIP